MGLYENIISLIVAGILFFAFMPKLFELSILTGISFVVVCGLSFHKGYVFEEPRIIGYIAIGHILTNLAVSQILPMFFESLLGGLFIQAIIIGVVFLVVYIRGKGIQNL